MNLKTYRNYRILTVIALSMSVSYGMMEKNFFIPVIAIIIATLFLLQLRKHVKEIVADERDYEIGGKAALLAIRIFGWFAIFPIFALYILRDRNPAYEPIGMTLSFATCFLMLLYAVIFRYYHKFTFSDKKTIYSIIVLIGLMILTVFSLRLFSGEDDWTCKDGQWVQHGHPSFPAPQVECK